MADIEVEETVEYDFDENVEDYSDDVEYNEDDTDQNKSKSKRIKLDEDVKAEDNEEEDDDVSTKSLESDDEDLLEEDIPAEEDMPAEDDNISDDNSNEQLKTELKELQVKYEKSLKEIEELKGKLEEPEETTDEKVQALEARISLIKTKAKEKIAEKEGVITEQNEKLKKFEEILALLESNCKQAVVKYNDAQKELAKKEETLQLHLSFKNRYDYKVNFLDEKNKKMRYDYEKRIQALEEKLAGGNPSTPGDKLVSPVPKSDSGDVTKPVPKPKTNKVPGPPGPSMKKPKSLKIHMIEAPQEQSKEGPEKVKSPVAKLPKVVKGLTITEIPKPSNAVADKESNTAEKSEASDEPMNSGDEEANKEETVSGPAVEKSAPITETSESETKSDKITESTAKAIAPTVTNLPSGIKITLTEAPDQLSQLDVD